MTQAAFLKSFTFRNYHSLKLKSSGLNVSTEMSLRAAELKQDSIEVLIKHRAKSSW